MMEFDPRHGWMAMAAAAGSITSLSMMPWKTMGWPERVLTLFVGFSFAYIVGPWIGNSVFGIKREDLGAICGATYIAGSAWNIFLPLVIKRMKAAFGSEEKA
jgi:hypothetical protein